PLRVFGALLALAANWARHRCFRALGRQFTFQVAIVKDHALITTGPYVLVRHPAYTSGLLKYAGNVLWHATRGAWLVESGFCAVPGAWVVLAPSILISALFVRMVLTRPQKEDALLKREFWEEWERWAEAVPYRLIPGVY
ncbi:hypothetical protein HYPSUDRAFT_132795, partial [Hypholoma sublateritium FD-334 SS-4]